jgi:hypothetical protein
MRRARRSFVAAIAILVGLLPAASRALASESTSDAKVRCAAAYEQAQELRRQDKLSASRSELMICNATCPRALALDCKRWLSEVEALMPTVLLRATDAQGHPVAARVLMDGALLVDRWGDAALSVDAGDHTFRFESPAGLSEDVRVSLHGGEREREIKAVLAPTADPLAGPSTPVPQTTKVLGAVGIGGLGVAGVLTLIGHFQVGHLESTCAPHCTSGQVGAVRALYDLGWVSAGVGVASLAAALFVWHPWQKSDAAAPAPPPISRVFVMPSYGGARIGIDFQ